MNFVKRHPVFSLWLILAAASRLFLHFSQQVELNKTHPGNEDAFPFELTYKPGIGVPVVVFSQVLGSEQTKSFWLDSLRMRPVYLIQPAFCVCHSGERPEAIEPVLHDFFQKESLDSVHLVLSGPLSGAAVSLITDKTKSVTFFGAAVFEEYTLLGNGNFNRAVYASLFALTKGLDVAVPHFGFIPFQKALDALYILNRVDLNKNNALIGAIDQPVLILHNRNDLVTAFASALEVHRTAKNSWLQQSESSVTAQLFSETLNHDFEDVERFQNSVEAGKFTAISSTQTQKIPFKPVGFSLLLIFTGIVLATFVTEDLTCFFAGMLAASGVVSFVFATAACVTGLVVGDFGLYLLGRAGRPLLRRAPFRYFISEEQLTKGGNWVQQHGAKVIFISRFTPGMRTITYVSAGLLHAPAFSFLFYFILASLAWTPLLVGISMLAGYQLLPYFTFMEKNLLMGLVSLWILLWFVKTWIIPMFTWKGRRLLLSKVKRLFMWEFWPGWLFNIPTVLNWFWLSARFRSMNAFTASNPGIPHSGFVGESKIQILSAIGDKEALAQFASIPCALPPEEQFRLFEEFLTREKLTYPVVLKPDVGQRGAGVAIIKNETQAREFLTAAKEDSILQEFIPGEEFGVFYVRYPWEPSGFIYSITEKKFTSVTGDGVSSLEKLILSGERTVCIAQSMLKKHADRLNYIPANGEVFKLTELGNHYRGALFLDGKRLITPEHEARIDAIAKSFPGFYYGRFDIRVPSAADLAAGRNIKVLELNGVTSEPTHIYEPGYSLWKGIWFVLNGWKMAFEIGLYNHRQGAELTSVRQLLSYYFDFLKKPSI